jgi:hypothetical protein
MVSISIPEKEKERIWKSLTDSTSRNWFETYKRRDNGYQMFSLVLDGITKHMTMFHYENWINFNFEYTIPITDVANYVVKRGIEEKLILPNLDKISPEVYGITTHFIKQRLYTAGGNLFDRLFVIGKTIKAYKDDEADNYNIQSMSGIAINSHLFDYELKEIEPKTKVKRGAWKREVIEDIQSLGLKQPRMVKGTVFVTRDYIKEEAMKEEASTNNILNVDIYNYETIASPTYETEHFEEKLTNAEKTARDFFKSILE